MGLENDHGGHACYENEGMSNIDQEEEIQIVSEDQVLPEIMFSSSLKETSIPSETFLSVNANNNNGTDVVLTKEHRNFTDSENSIEVLDLEANKSSRRKAKKLEKPSQEELNLLLRPSYCNAAFALSQVKQNKAEGNRFALFIRSHIHNCLFALGCFIQRRSFFVLIIGLLVLGACCVGLMDAHLETDLEKLWVETGGKLEAEVQYQEYAVENTRNRLGASVQSANETGSYNIIIQTGTNVATVDSLLLQLKAAEAVTKIKIADSDGEVWDLQEVCEKLPLGKSAGDGLIDQLIEQVLPCVIIGPLDCFWEGSKVLGPFLKPDESVIALEWTALNPNELFNLVIGFVNIGIFGPELSQSILSYRDLLMEAGAGDGYLKRPCLNSSDPLCPKSAPNFNSKQPPNVMQVLTEGCKGFAEEKMVWPVELNLGGISRNSSGQITKAEGLQTLFKIQSVEAFYQKFKDHKKAGKNWNREKAQKIVESWQHQFVKVVFEVSKNETRSGSTEDKLFAFSGATINEVLEKFAQIGVDRVIWGYVLMIGYACLSLIRSRPSRSQGAVGMLGVLLIILSVAGGLGLCSFIGISFNPASTQVLPFLLLGLGVDDMFLMTHHFGDIATSSHIPYQNRMGECLRRVGMSIFLTSISITAGFLFSIVIPMPALRSFAFQAVVVTCFNFLVVLLIFPAILSIDLERRRRNKWDIFCCINSSSPSDVTGSSSDVRAELFYAEYPETNTVTSETSDQKVSANEVLKTNSSSGVDVAANRKKFSQVSNALPNISQLAEDYYAPFLLKTPVRIAVIILFAGLLGFSLYECTQIKDGLDLGDVLPRGTQEHATLVAQSEYFSFYDMYIITQDFDYPANQKTLFEIHGTMIDLPYILLNPDGSLIEFWLQFFTEWLEGMQIKLDKAWENGEVNSSSWKNAASEDVKIAYWMLVQTGDPDQPIDLSLVGCQSGANCTKPDKTRLILEDGTIPQKVFYNYFTVWCNRDLLNYAVARPNFIPKPLDWDFNSTLEIEEIPASHPLVYSEFPYYLNDMRENEDFVFVINWVRNVLEKFEKETPVKAYPSGYPFTFWQQYVTLRFWLFIALACVIFAVFLVLTIVLVNPWSAFIMAFFLAMITAELLGYMGLAGVKLSAVPAVILVASVGVGVEFTVHICYAFLTASGTKKQRVTYSLGHMMGPVIDGAISTLLGVIMLAWAEFDIIVKYFFEVLAVLIFLGVINGLILLPVVLSLIGPAPEVTINENDPRFWKNRVRRSVDSNSESQSQPKRKKISFQGK